MTIHRWRSSGTRDLRGQPARATGLAALALAVSAAASLSAQVPAPGLPPALRDVGIDQKVDAQAPLDLHFRDEEGRSVRLGDLLDGRPTVLALVYYRCPMLCGEVLNGLLMAALGAPFRIGEDYRIITVSFDPQEGPALAAAKKASYLKRLGRPGSESGWRFLTGEETQVRALAGAVGFRYAWDPASKQYVHAAGLVVLTPGGRVARYLLGIAYEPLDLRLALVEASQGKVGSPVDRALLYCYRYDPTAGKYGLVVMNVIQLSGAVTVLALGALIAGLFLNERRRARRPAARSGTPGPGR